jgi:hypothetical protein
MNLKDFSLKIKVEEDKMNDYEKDIIVKIEIISRPDEINTFFTMCGFKITFSNNQAICIGSYLTDLKIPEPWILFLEEVEENLIYQPLILKSE